MDRILFILFRVTSSTVFWLRRRLTSAGLFVLASLVASGAVGLDTNLTLAYQIFTLLLALLLLSFVADFLVRTRVDARRILPRFGTAGRPLTYHIRVTGRERKTLHGLVLEELLADPRPTWREYSSAADPGPAHRRSWPGKFGYARWRSLLGEKRVAVIKDQVVDAVSQAGENEVRIEVTPSRRGVMRFEGMFVSRCDPFGLVKAGAALPLQQSMLILPRRYPLPPVRLPGTRVYQQGGVSLAGSIGDSEEFVSLRDYQPGDPLRRIHWKSWARTGKPVVKEYQEEFFVRHALVLDTFRGSGSPSAFEEAVSVAASFAFTVDTQESLLDLLFVGAEVYCVTMGRGIGRAEQALETLASVRPCTTRPFEDLRRAVMARAAGLSGCICILLTWDDARRRFLNGLKELGIPVLAIVIIDPGAPDAARPDPAENRVHALEVGKIGEGLASLRLS